MDRKTVEDVRRMRVVAKGWMATLKRNKYTDKLLLDIEQLVVKAEGLMEAYKHRDVKDRS